MMDPDRQGISVTVYTKPPIHTIDIVNNYQLNNLVGCVL